MSYTKELPTTPALVGPGGLQAGDEEARPIQKNNGRRSKVLLSPQTWRSLLQIHRLDFCSKI